MGGRFSVQVVDDPFDWDPTDRGKSLPNQWGLGLAYESLVGFKNGPGVSFEAAELQPELAERWEVSPDSSVFTFFLRKGVKFANIAPVNGREMTSADVKWSYEYFSRTGSSRTRASRRLSTTGCSRTSRALRPPTLHGESDLQSAVRPVPVLRRLTLHPDHASRDL